MDLNHINKKLWRHQDKFFHFARHQEATLFHGGMGVGKTLSSLALMPPVPAWPHLIIAPKVMLNTWRDEILSNVSGDYRVLVLDKGSIAKKAEQLSEAVSLNKAKDDGLYVVVNYESVWRGQLGILVGRLGWHTIVADECHRIKSPGSKQSRFMARLASNSYRRLALSGTPFPQGPLDAYGIYRFLKPTVFGKSYYPFRNRYAIMGGFGGKQVVGYQRTDELNAKINERRFYAGRDLLDLPDAVHHRISLTMPDKAARLYGQLSKEMYAWIKQGVEVSAANALVKLLRLQQMTSGYVKDDDGKLAELHTTKQAATEEILEDVGPEEKVVVFCRFTHDIKAAKKAAENVGRAAYEISGSLNELLAWRHADDDGAVLCVQIDSGSEGISLVDARHCIMWSVGFSLSKYLQALARTHRPGQKDTCFYHHLIVEGSVDDKVYKALQKKQDVIESIIGEVS
jgi:SNF2 family DNA or RNA helicase